MTPHTVLAPLLASSAYVLELALFPLLLSAIRLDLGLSREMLALTVTLYAISVAAAVLLSGWLSDRLGPGPMFRAGAIGFILGSAGVALADGLVALLAARVLQGLGGGLMSPSIPVLLSRASGGRPGRLLSLWYSLSGFIVAVAPFGAVRIQEALGWQAVVWVTAAIALPALFLPTVGGAAAPARHPPDRSLGAVVADLLARRPVVLFLYVGLTYGCALLFLFAAPLHLADRGAGPGQIAATVAGFWGAFALAGFALRNRIDGPALGPLLALSPPILCIAAALFFLVPAGAPWGLAAALVAGVGFSLCNATSTTLILRHAPADGMALAASLDISFARAGSVAMVGLFGALAPAGLAVALVLPAGVALLCALPYRRGGGTADLPAAAPR